MLVAARRLPASIPQGRVFECAEAVDDNISLDRLAAIALQEIVSLCGLPRVRGVSARVGVHVCRRRSHL